MGLRATGLSDDAYAGFYLDKRDPSGINYTGAVFTVYKDQDLNSIAGELRDDDNDGIYTDFYLLSGSGFTKQKYRLTPKDQAGSTYEDTLYIKETTLSCLTEQGRALRIRMEISRRYISSQIRMSMRS